MAKTRMVTRTVKGTLITALCLDLETAEPQNVVTQIIPRIKDSNKEIAALRKKLDSDTFKFVAVVDREDTAEIYGMPEEEFLAHAVKIDKNPDEANNESEEE